MRRSNTSETFDRESLEGFFAHPSWARRPPSAACIIPSPSSSNPGFDLPPFLLARARTSFNPPLKRFSADEESPARATAMPSIRRLRASAEAEPSPARRSIRRAREAASRKCFAASRQSPARNKSKAQKEHGSWKGQEGHYRFAPEITVNETPRNSGTYVGFPPEVPPTCTGNF